MDPRSGEILALAESPARDPNHFRELGDSAFKSAAFLDATEPGSVMKAFLVAAALDAEVVQSDSVFDCESGSYRIAGSSKKIKDAKPYGELDLASILRVSSNVCTVKIAEVLGARAHFETLRRFGFGRKTGSGFPAESAGILNPWQQWGPVERATIAYGQGISVTAAQVAAAASALANGGELLQPRLVLGHRSHGGRWHPTRRRVVRRVIGSEQARQVLQMLEHVVAQSPVGIVVVDTYRDVVYTNGRAKELGLVRDRLLDDRAWLAAQRTLNTGEAAEVDLSPRERSRPGRSGLSVRGHVRLLTEDDRRFAVVYLDDQSEHARMEATRRDFVANVSHELKTPVGAMGVLAEAILASNDDPETIRRFAAKMVTESNRLAD
ncbi:MAG: penicillin-binding transpeptidase domain-containing protein, partial [Myxococcota bacterium]